MPTAVLELLNDTVIGAAWGPRVAFPARLRAPELRIARFAVTVVFALKVVVLAVGEFRYRPVGSRVTVKVAVA